jgi:hypothetical protein
MDDKTAAFFGKLDPTQQAQYLYDSVGKAVVVERVIDLFRRNLRGSTASHEAIPRLPIRTIVTTNWDNLLEKQFEEERITCDVIWKDQQVGATTHRRKILKVHGTLEDIDSIIFSEDDYFRFANSSSIYKQYLGTLLATSTVLFVGYSYSDFDFRLMFHSIRQQLNIMARKSYIFTPNATEAEKQYLYRRGLIPIYYSAPTRQEASEAFFSDLVEEASIIAETRADRLKVMRRENGAMLKKARGLLIRNQSNLGPLATPETLTDPGLFGSLEITKLEIECAANWRALIENGATAKCILCLSNPLARGKYRADEARLRLQVLKSNIERYRDSVEAVDIGTPLDSNIEIYGNAVLLRSEKLDVETKSYNRLRVIRDIDVLRQTIETFDTRFNSVRVRNLAQASLLFNIDLTLSDAAAEREVLHRYIIHLIDLYIESL